MCCFSKPVQSVSATRIFARCFPPGTESNRQYLVYQMRLDTKEDVAMILPIPVAPESGEKAVKFINLEGYPDFFKALNAGFPKVKYFRLSDHEPMAGVGTLEVESVGSFQASYVPTVDDFARLDPQFRLPAETWQDLPQYRSHGFAVFKMKPGAKTIHPMAFSFPRADAKELFFPTVHIHDGTVHATAEFEHELFCQRQAGERMRLSQWMESHQPAAAFMDMSKIGGVLDPELHCHRIIMTGVRKNEDVRLPA